MGDPAQYSSSTIKWSGKRRAASPRHWCGGEYCSGNRVRRGQCSYSPSCRGGAGLCCLKRVQAGGQRLVFDFYHRAACSAEPLTATTATSSPMARLLAIRCWSAMAWPIHAACLTGDDAEGTSQAAGHFQSGMGIRSAPGWACAPAKSVSHSQAGRSLSRNRPRSCTGLRCGELTGCLVSFMPV
jgi:hypothetical protein